MIKPTLYAKWISLVFAAFVLAACSSNDTKEAEAAAAIQAANEAAAKEVAAKEDKYKNLKINLEIRSLFENDL